MVLKMTIFPVRLRSVALSALLPIATSSVFPVMEVKAEVKIGIVSVQQIIDRSQMGREAKEKVEALAKREQVKLAQLKAELERTQEDLQRQGGLLSGKALEEKSAALRKREKDLARSMSDRREELVRQNREEVAKVVRAIDKAAIKFGADEGYVVLLEADPSLVLHHAKRLDVTEKVIQALDQGNL